MKNLFFALLLTCASASVFAQKADKQTLTVNTKIYCDHCIQCGSCKANIDDHIRANEGIIKVKVNAKENTITIVYDANKTNPTDIREAINAAGYDADDQKAPLAAVSSLDDCCRKPKN